MIELTIMNHLSSYLDVPVYMERPDSLVPSYVIFEKTSGGERNTVKSATFAIQSYADSLYESALLNESVKEAMDALVEVPTVSRSKLNSDYNYTDTATKKYRYQAVYDIVYF